MEGLQSAKLPRAASWSTVPRPSVIRLAARRPESAGLMEEGQSLMVMEHMQGDR